MLRAVRNYVLLAGALALGLAACGDATPSADGDGRPRIVTTVAPITSIAAAVAGDLAEVRGLVPEGTNSHTWEPPPSAAKALARADLVVLNGLGLEEPTRDLAGDAPLLELGDAALEPDEHIYDFSFPREGGRPNPHLWTSPPLAKEYARALADRLAAIDEDDAAGYRANYERFAAKVDALDAAMRSATATIPAARRKLVTYHDAWAYFADHYGWTVVGAIQPSSFDDPTAREVVRLIEQVRGEGVPAVFGSEVFPSPVLRRIGAEANVRYVDVLRDDDLPGAPGDAEHSWLGLMRFDFVTMVEALGGDASALEALDVRLPVVDRAVYPQ